MSDQNKKRAYYIESSFMPEGHPSVTEYAQAAHPFIEKYGGKLIVAGFRQQPIEELEGEWENNARLTIFEFPSKEAVLNFWNDPEYKAIKHLRTDATPPNFTIAVDGFDPSMFS